MLRLDHVGQTEADMIPEKLFSSRYGTEMQTEPSALNETPVHGEPREVKVKQLFVVRASTMML